MLNDIILMRGEGAYKASKLESVQNLHNREIGNAGTREQIKKYKTRQNAVKELWVRSYDASVYVKILFDLFYSTCDVTCSLCPILI